MNCNVAETGDIHIKQLSLYFNNVCLKLLILKRTAFVALIYLGKIVFRERTSIVHCNMKTSALQKVLGIHQCR